MNRRALDLSFIQYFDNLGVFFCVSIFSFLGRQARWKTKCEITVLQMKNNGLI